jgi:hypothetical protein
VNMHSSPLLLFYRQSRCGYRAGATCDLAPSARASSTEVSYAHLSCMAVRSRRRNYQPTDGFHAWLPDLEDEITNQLTDFKSSDEEVESSKGSAAVRESSDEEVESSKGSAAVLDWRA